MWKLDLSKYQFQSGETGIWLENGLGNTEIKKSFGKLVPIPIVTEKKRVLKVFEPFNNVKKSIKYNNYTMRNNKKSCYRNIFRIDNDILKKPAFEKKIHLKSNITSRLHDNIYFWYQINMKARHCIFHTTMLYVGIRLIISILGSVLPAALFMAVTCWRPTETVILKRRWALKQAISGILKHISLIWTGNTGGQQIRAKPEDNMPSGVPSPTRGLHQIKVSKFPTQLFLC